MKKILYLTIVLISIFLDQTFSQSNLDQKDFIIKIVRTSENNKSTTGEMFINEKFICHTLELPWKNNTSYISSIPTGSYTAHLRYDKNDQWRIQLDNVPNRTGVQIHIGNWPKQIEGCVLVGTKTNNAKNEIVKGTSADAYKMLKKEFYGTSTPSSSPDKNITINIEYKKGRTVLKSLKSSFTYIKQSIWEQAFANNSQKNDWKEYLRDLKFIYLRDQIGFAYIKMPIHGGQLFAATGQNGPWRKGEIFKREN